jgi:hypothetical protein
MPVNDPFVCKRCHGNATYDGRRGGETVYRCRSCGSENRFTHKSVAQQQQQPQAKPREPTEP